MRGTTVMPCAALAIHRKTVGERGWRTGENHCTLAKILRKAGQTEEADAEQQLGYEILVESLGEDHPRTVQAKPAGAES